MVNLWANDLVEDKNVVWTKIESNLKVCEARDDKFESLAHSQ